MSVECVIVSLQGVLASEQCCCRVVTGEVDWVVVQCLPSCTGGLAEYVVWGVETDSDTLWWETPSVTLNFSFLLLWCRFLSLWCNPLSTKCFFVVSIVMDCMILVACSSCWWGCSMECSSEGSELNESNNSLLGVVSIYCTPGREATGCGWTSVWVLLVLTFFLWFFLFARPPLLRWPSLIDSSGAASLKWGRLMMFRLLPHVTMPSSKYGSSSFTTIINSFLMSQIKFLRSK